MRQKVVAILTAPLRLLRRLLGLLLRAVRLLLRPVGLLRKVGNPLRKLAALQGKQRIAAFVILGVVVVVVVLALRPGPNEEKDVRATLDRYAQATRAKDYQALCDDLFARDIVSGLSDVGLPCEVALRNSSFETVRNPQLRVLGVEVSGEQALARTRSTAVGEAASLDTIKLVKQDGIWRVASLSEPGAAAAAGATP
jgi:hypothetical protein